MLSDIQAAAERIKRHEAASLTPIGRDIPEYVSGEHSLIRDWATAARAAVRVPQLIAALKSIRATAEKQIRTRLAGMYGWKTETIDKCVEDNELIKQLDAAIAAVEGRDANRS